VSDDSFIETIRILSKIIRETNPGREGDLRVKLRRQALSMVGTDIGRIAIIDPH
jgi:hypothetical protein